MARKLSPLTASLVLDINKWTAGIKQVQKDQQALTNALKPLREQTKQLGTVFVAAGVAVGGAMLAMAKKAADFGDEMLEASQKTGLSTKSLSAFKILAEQSGSSFEGITAGVGKLSKAMFEAGTKGGEAAKTFAALGISVKDSGGQLKQASDVLPQIAERFANMRDGTEKTALAMRLFGKAGADLIPMLNQGADGIRRATELTEKYSISLTEAEAKLGDEFNDTLGESKAAMMGLALQIGNALLPAMTKMVAIGNNVIAMVARWAKENPGLTRTVAAIAGVLTGTGGLLLAMSAFTLIAPKMIAQISALSKAFVALSVPARVAVIAIAALTAAFLAFPQIRGPVIATVEKIVQVFGLIPSVLGHAVAVVVRMLKGEWEAAWFQAENTVEIVTARWQKNGQMVRDAFAGIGKGLADINSATQVKGFGKEFAVDLESLGKEANKTKDLVDQMWASLKRENAEVEALTAVLMRAEAAHIDYQQVLDKLGPTIADVADEFRKSGEPMPEIISFYDFLRRNSLELAAAQEEELRTLQELNAARFNFEKQIDADRIAFSKMTEVVIDTPFRTVADDIKEGAERMKAQREEAERLAKSIRILAGQGKSLEEIEEMLGVRIDDVAKKTKDQGLAAMVAAQQLRDSWGASLARLSDQLVDMIVDFDFSFRRLKDIATNTAKDMARAFLDGFFKPFKDGLNQLGQQAGKFAASLIFGTGGASTANNATQASGGGLLGGILGGGGGGLLGGILGGSDKGGLLGKLGGIFGGGGGGTAGAGAAATGMVMPMDPITAALQAFNLGFDAVTKVTDKIGKGRDSANEIVKSQNAFVNETLKGILADDDLSATNKLKQVVNAWEGFQANLARFSAAGGEGGVTANQAFATISPLVANIQRDLIKAGASDTGEIGEGGIHIEHLHIELKDIHTPEELKRWFALDAAGFRTDVLTAVKKSTGVVSAV